MARLVIGTSKAKTVPAVVIEKTTPEPYIEYTVANGKLTSTTSRIMDFTGVTEIGVGLENAYNGNTNISGAVDMSDVQTISSNYGCSGMFANCTGLTSVDLSSLTSITGSYGCSNMFQGCTGLTSVDLSSLATISSSYACINMFSNCTNITSINLSSLASISGTYGCSNMFSGCTSLTSLSFPALTSTSFGTKTNQFNKMLEGVTGCAVHFPSNLQSVIGSWADVTNGFGGTNTTVSFDLPATE